MNDVPSGPERCICGEECKAVEHDYPPIPDPVPGSFDDGREFEQARIVQIIDEFYAFRPKAEQRVKVALLAAIKGENNA